MSTEPHKDDGKASLLLSVAEAAVKGHPLAVENAKPKEAVLALELMAAGKTRAEIQEATGISFITLTAIRARHDLALDLRRKELANEGFELAAGYRMLQQEKMEQLANDPEALKKVNIKDLAIAGAVAQDKAFAALGEATRHIVEHRKGPSIEDVRAEIEAARAAVRAKSIEVVVQPTNPDGEQS